MNPWMIALAMMSVPANQDHCVGAWFDMGMPLCRDGYSVEYRDKTSKDGTIYDLQVLCCPNLPLSFPPSDTDYDGTPGVATIRIDFEENGDEWEVQPLGDWICLRKREGK